MKFQNSAVFYKSLFENTIDGLAYCQMLFNIQGNPVDFIHIKVNKNYKKLMGVKEAAGKKFSEIMPKINASDSELIKIYGRVALTGKEESFELCAKSLAKWFFIRAYSPRKKFFVAILKNITGQKRAERYLENARMAAQNVLNDLQAEKEALAYANAKNEAILSSIGDGVIAVGLDGRIALMNKIAEKLLGWKINEAIGKLYNEIIFLEDEKGTLVPIKERPFNEIFSPSSATTAKFYLISKNKIKFPVAITASPIILEGKIIGAVEVFRDITKEKEIDKAKTEFVSLASHQLRTPLTTISWYTEMILNGDVGKVISGQKKYLEEIYEGNFRMIELVNTLLDVSRIELGTFMIEPKPIDIVKLAQSEVGEQKPQIDQKKITLSFAFEKNIPIVQADPKLLRIVMQNILSNAVKYTPEKGKISFSLALDNKKKNILLKISDTGCGIPKKQQDKIFTKLFRADNVREKDVGGTGLGLYIAKAIMEQSGGLIWFESEENKGSTFFAALPLSGMKKKEGAKALI